MRVIVKHYWDEKTFATKIEPDWVTNEKLQKSKPQKDISKVVKKLVSPAFYNKLSLEKPEFIEIEGYKIYMCYKDKDDPDPTNNRKVTDITFVITDKYIREFNCYEIERIKENLGEIKEEKNRYLFYVVVILLFLSFVYVGINFRVVENKSEHQSKVLKTNRSLSNQRPEIVKIEDKKSKLSNGSVSLKSDENKRKAGDNKDVLKKSNLESRTEIIGKRVVVEKSKSKSENMNISKKDKEVSKICREILNVILHKGYCYEYYLEYICRSKKPIEYYEWVSSIGSKKYIECKAVGDKDKDFVLFLNKHREIKRILESKGFVKNARKKDKD